MGMRANPIGINRLSLFSIWFAENKQQAYVLFSPAAYSVMARLFKRAFF
jgi:hypothetical protein